MELTMTDRDRHAGYIVTLNKNIREDEAKPILEALAMIKGVMSVEPVIDTPEIHIAESRAKQKFHKKLLKLLKEE